MTPESMQNMTSTCHALAEYILRQPTLTNRGTWLKREIAQRLVDSGLIEALASQYEADYPYADVPTEYLAKTLQAYDQKEDF